ncbi:MAG: DUF1971 domain-containing protein [Pseudomonadales bacterium]
MPKLPADFIPYKQTPQFTQNTVPKGLLSEHTTKAGTWGVLAIESGTLLYRITEPGHEAEYVLEPNKPGIIVAEQPHHISTMGDVSFHIEFYRRPEPT